MLVVYGVVIGCFCLTHDWVLGVVWSIFWLVVLRIYHGNARLFVIALMVIAVQSLPPPLSETFQGVVVAHHKQRYTVVGVNQSAYVYTKQDLALDSVVTVKGSYQRSNDASRRRFQSFFYPRIQTQAHLPSLKRIVAKRLETDATLHDIFFLNYGDDQGFALSMAWRIAGFLSGLSWCLRPYLGEGKTKRLCQILIVLYGGLINCNVAIFRLILKSFIKQDMQIIVLLALFPRLVVTPFFVLVYGPFLIENLSHALRNKRHLFAFLSLSHALNTVNLFQFMAYKLLRLLAGLEFACACFYIIMPVLGVVSYQALMLLKPIVSACVHHAPEIRGGLWPLLSIIIIWIGAYSVFKAWVVVVVAFFLLYVNPFAMITFINVGQGDATLIQDPYGQGASLIDTGKPSAYGALKKTLLRKGIRHLDRLIVTHDDLDHSGNVSAIERDFLKGTTYREKGVTIAGFRTYVNDIAFAQANANSLLLRSDYGAVFTGDAGVLQEYLLSHDPSLVAPILKLGHHGSKTSSFYPFLKHVRPKLAIVSSKPSVYGHPHRDVMKRLYDLRIASLQTSIEGNITVYFWHNFIFFITEKGTWGIIS